MLGKALRFSRATFPIGRAKERYSLPWGAVSVYDAPQFRAGVVVSKKVLKKAHDRNRLRRRLYEAIGHVLPKNPPAIGLAVFPRKEALTAPYTAIVEDLKKVIL